MNEAAILQRLLDHGLAWFRAPAQSVEFTKSEPADRLLNDLVHHPHAFVLASLMDQQIRAERAWFAPFRLKERLGDFSMKTLLALSETDLRQLVAEEQLHRYIDRMSGFLFRAIRHIAECYESDASRIWSGKPSSADVVYKLLAFDGIGPKIACMDANMLATDFKVELADYFSIDISADVHVCRVFARLGLVPSGSSTVQVIWRARSLHPEFPGLLDGPTWEIGRQWCRPNGRRCQACYMRDLCPSVTEQ